MKCLFIMLMIQCRYVEHVIPKRHFIFMCLMYIFIEHLNIHKLPTICWDFVVLQHGLKGQMVEMDPSRVISYCTNLIGSSSSFCKLWFAFFWFPLLWSKTQPRRCAWGGENFQKIKKIKKKFSRLFHENSIITSKFVDVHSHLNDCVLFLYEYWCKSDHV